MPIHARLRYEDEENEEGPYFVFRYWGDSGGGYYTPEMTKAQMAQWFLEYELEKVLSGFAGGFEQSIYRAEQRGTSGWGREDLLGPWEEPHHGKDKIAKENPEKYLGSIVEVVSLYGKDDFVVDGKKFRVSIKVEQEDVDV